eukprot:CAMPEP_0174827760 /NCGR_PEP_ID=MMETSP1114-20130205/915_1 /TAXON_ID=312471 /ORGANISM="Neobodo designis, Strain CCAP 1951/1" /LENGTH=266 /DNA_ID=CAMNT_0016061437 /DNA_START=107 /DNA_END=907 /DNA_ORIENTATION=+
MSRGYRIPSHPFSQTFGFCGSNDKDHTPGADAQQPRAPPRDERPLILAERFHTRLCKSFRKSGTCEYGAFCMFAHGKARLRTVDANVRDGLTTTEAIRAWQRARAAEAAAEELKLLPFENGTVGRVEAEHLSVGVPLTFENSASELPSAGVALDLPAVINAAIASDSPGLPSSGDTMSTGRPNNTTRVYRHDPYRVRVLTDTARALLRRALVSTTSDGVGMPVDPPSPSMSAASTTTIEAGGNRRQKYQHLPYDAVPVSLGPVMLP